MTAHRDPEPDDDGPWCPAVIAAFYAWCFSHGRLHYFIGEPWCTATWVAFTATTEQAALEAKQHTYGDARFLHELPAAQQLDVIDIREAHP